MRNACHKVCVSGQESCLLMSRTFFCYHARATNVFFVLRKQKHKWQNCAMLKVNIILLCSEMLYTLSHCSVSRVFDSEKVMRAVGWSFSSNLHHLFTFRLLVLLLYSFRSRAFSRSFNRIFWFYDDLTERHKILTLYADRHLKATEKCTQTAIDKRQILQHSVHCLNRCRPPTQDARDRLNNFNLLL